LLLGQSAGRSQNGVAHGIAMTSPRLIDAFTDVLAYASTKRVPTVGDKTPYDTVRQEIDLRLKQSESFRARGLCSEADYNAARYAVCAWIDETILASAWEWRAQWRADLLQRRFYQSTDAGQRFFTQLDAIPVEKTQLREVFYFCMALGFQGRYCMPEDGPARDALKQRHLKILFDNAADTPSVHTLEKDMLFPAAYPEENSKQLLPRHVRRFSTPWLFIVGPLTTVCMLFAIYRFTLYSVGENLLKGLR